MHRDTKYGLMIGRFQPLHNGHLAVLDEILASGKTPIIVIGSTQKNRNINRNPLSFEERVELFNVARPELTSMGAHFIKQEDKSSYERWAEYINVAITYKLGIEVGNVYIYTGDKDNAEALYAGIEVSNDMDMFVTLKGYQVDTVSCASIKKIHTGIHATDIRNDFEGNKEYMSTTVYTKLKEWGWK